MTVLRAVRSTGVIFLAIFLLSVDSGVFAAPTNVGQRGSASNNLAHSAKQKIIESIGETILCDFCKLVVKLVQSIFETNASEDFIADVITTACKKFQIEDDYICTTIVQEFKVWHGWQYTCRLCLRGSLRVLTPDFASRF